VSKDVIITITEMGRMELERAAKAVPEDRLNWKPLDNGRTVLDALGDAAQSPAMCTAILHDSLPYGPELFQRLAQERAAWTREDALQHLESNTQQLLEEIKQLPAQKLDEPLTLPMGGGMTLPVGAWLLIAYRSFMARAAQINYIQTLYGDFDRH
jgi:hypothetical protein